jgi:hypothetical protein
MEESEKSHAVDLQCFTQMLGSFVVDFNARERKCGQCLPGVILVIKEIDERSDCLTRLTFNPSARCSAPVVSVMKRIREKRNSLNVCEEKGNDANSMGHPKKPSLT